jgi:hypothetical protein
MTDVAAVRNPPTAPGWKDEGVHFLRAVTDMAEHCNVVTGEPIFNDKGVKLVDKGARIDSRMYERLVKHKLRDPIDKHLGVDNRVDVLAIEAQAMCSARPWTSCADSCSRWTVRTGCWRRCA